MRDSSIPPSVDFPFYTDDDHNRTIMHPAKRTKQWAKWTSLLPSLTNHYMQLMCKSESLRNVNFDSKLPCTCDGSSQKVLHVLCVHFDGI